MIKLRVAHVLSSLNVSAACSEAINLMRWLQANGHYTLLLSGEGDRIRDLSDDELALHSYSCGRAGWWLGGKRRIVRELGSWRPDLLHVHQAQCLEQFCAVAESLQVPLVASLQTMEPPVDPQVLRHPAVAMITVPSEALRAHYVGRLGFGRDLVAVLPYGLDFPRYPQVDPPERIGTVCAIGRYEPAFGLDDFLEALAKLRVAGVTVAGRVIGSGSGWQVIHQTIARLELTDVVEVVSSRGKTGDHLRSVDLYVYPCRQDVVTLTVLKAMACSRPIVATAVGSMTEWLQDGQNGILVPPRDVDALAAAIRYCHESPERVAGLAKAARTFVEAHHDLDLVGNAAHQLYRTVLRTGAGESRVGSEAVRAYRRLTSTHAKARG